MTRATGIEYDYACVLLSGGFDSVAALHYAIGRYKHVRAIGFSYGQPHRDAEITLAQRVAKKRGVQFTGLALCDALATRAGLMGGVRDHDGREGINRAFVPGRNIVFLSLAAAHALTWFPSGYVDFVIGACAEDATGFPDCRETTLTEFGGVLRKACARELRIVAPFAKMTKTQILRSVSENVFALDDVQRSWSCYRGLETGPCGACSACVTRARAFAECELEDMSRHPVMTGGDPHRERNFK